jgi:hypothetical protein
MVVYTVAVPDRRRFGHVDVVSDSKCLHVWTGRGEKGDGGDQAKIGQLTLSMGPAKVEIRLLFQRATIPCKRVIFTLVNTIHAFIIIYMLVMLCIENTFSPLQVKNKLCEGETEHGFILGSLDSTVANSRL